MRCRGRVRITVRIKTVEVELIDLDLKPDLEAETLEGVCTTTVRALDEDVERLALDAVDLEVGGVDRDGVAQRFTCRNGKLEIAFDPALRPGERTTFSVRYRVSKPRHGLFFVKPTAAHPEKVVHAWTQSQDENARFWFPCLDYPHEKQRTSATITVPKGTFALGNGELVERKDVGDATVFKYRQEIPHSTYLTTMVAGPFVEVAQGAVGEKNVPVFYYVLPGREADGERAFGKTAKMLETFEERTGAPYPYARYSQIAVGDFIFGGMENTSATTQTDRTLHDAIAHLDFSSDPLVSHELAHQWFGDLLTCRDWSHAWLNEGFATFFETIWLEADLGYDEYLYGVFECVAAYLEEDADRYRRPIVYNRYRDPIEIFDRHLYQKGAAVLHMLRGELGDARFWRSIRHYVERNAQRNVETIDFIRAIEDATGRNLRGFFDQWVFRGGHPELEVSATWDEKRKVTTVVVDQKQPIDGDHPAYRFELTLGFAARADRPPAANAGAGQLAGRAPHSHGRRARPRNYLRSARIRTKTDSVRPGRVRAGRRNVQARFGICGGRAARRSRRRRAHSRGARTCQRRHARGGRGAARNLRRRSILGRSGRKRQPRSVRRAPLGRGAYSSRLLPIAIRKSGAPSPRRWGTFAMASWPRRSFRSPRTTRRTSCARAALESLGKTRDPRAFDVLAAAVEERTWNASVEGGAVRGLAELAESRAFPLVLAAARPERDDGLRRAAAAAIGRIGQLVEEDRTRAVRALEDLLDDPAFLVQIAALRAAESLGDARLLSAFDRLAQSAFDGRTRRDALEAAIRVREAAKIPAQVSGMRSDIDGLREEQQKLQEKIEALSRS